MGSIYISYLGLFLIFTSGWLIVGWPTYLFTTYKHGEISYRFTLMAATVGVLIGIYLIGVALKLPFFVTLCTSLIVGIATLIGIVAGLRKNS